MAAMDNPFTALHADLEKVITDHGSEIESALDTAARVADNPAAQAVLGLLHFPPASAVALGEFLQKIDADFAALQPAAPSPAAAVTPPDAAAAGPAEPPLFQAS